MRIISKHVTVAQVGVGYWGPNLLRNLAANEDCHVKMVADLSEERCCYAKNLYPGVNVTKDADKVFNDREIDEIDYATSSQVSDEIAEFLLGFVDKVIIHLHVNDMY